MRRAIAVKRIYEPRAKDDGWRVLVDRVWPRGVSKADAAIDWWARDIAPSTALRRWFDHDPAKWSGFRQRYRRELGGRAEALQALLREAGRHRRITLLYAAKDTQHNQAVVLQDVLKALQDD